MNNLHPPYAAGTTVTDPNRYVDSLLRLLARQVILQYKQNALQPTLKRQELS